MKKYTLTEALQKTAEEPNTYFYLIDDDQVYKLRKSDFEEGAEWCVFEYKWDGEKLLQNGPVSIQKFFSEWDYYWDGILNKIYCCVEIKIERKTIFKNA